MARAQASPEALRRFATDLRRAQEEVRDLARGLERKMGALDWDDEVRRRIEGDVHQVSRSLVRFVERLDEHATEVERKAADLERYLG